MDDVGGFVSQKISEWAALRRRHTLQLLAEKTGVGYSTVRRISPGEAINFQTFMQLAAVILSPEETREAVNKYFPGTRHSLERAFTFYTPEKDPIRSADALQVVALCCPDGGIPFDQLIKSVGTKKAALVGHLISSELLAVRDGNVCLSQDFYFSPDPSRVLRWIKYAAELFDFDNADKHGQFSCFRIEGLNEDGIRRVHKLFAETEKSLDAIISEKPNRGEMSVSMALFTTTNSK